MLVLASREEGRWHVPGPMVASRAAGEPPDALPCSLAIIVVAAGLGSTLVPLLVSFLVFSTSKLRRSPMFALCIVGLCLGLALSALLCTSQILLVLYPTHPFNMSLTLTMSILFPTMSIFVDSILLFRLYSVYPPQYYTTRKIVLRLGPSVLIKFIRTANLVFGQARVLHLATEHGHWPGEIYDSLEHWTKLGTDKAEFMMEAVDNTYVSFLFLALLREAHRLSAQSADAHDLSRTTLYPYTTRLRTLTYLTMLTFALPTSLTLTSFALTFAPASARMSALLICLFFANNIARLVCVLLATAWAARGLLRCRVMAHGSDTDEDDVSTVVFEARRRAWSWSLRRSRSRRSGEGERTYGSTWDPSEVDLPSPLSANVARHRSDQASPITMLSAAYLYSAYRA